MLKFDAETTRLLDIAYEGADLTRRRQASFDALKPSPGDTIIDIGCGNGLLTAELARAVGSTGKIIGVDPSKDMLKAGRNRCQGHQNVEFAEGLANNLPVSDGAADKAVSVQVFEYIDDVESALDDAMRCLKPGGRLVISDLHFGSFIWYSGNPERMSNLVSSWDKHFVSGTVPERLPGLLKAKGHEVDAVTPVTLTDHELKPDGIAIMMMHLMKQYAIANGHVEEAEAQAWFDEQQALSDEGRFFFSLTQFVVAARKSA
ncbi:methyltransferase domain-containing protein [Ruegeria arenilitoris]|uniref:methyltransferase domain-containing protein n=1 Tax=Ruegeria arenilitoris TaxID=1173585 RepID=UPI00147AD993|nr:methyltransferase domain-containing protein [Ruegeria arenilitoris]